MAVYDDSTATSSPSFARLVCGGEREGEGDPGGEGDPAVRVRVMPHLLTVGRAVAAALAVAGAGAAVLPRAARG